MGCRCAQRRTVIAKAAAAVIRRKPGAAATVKRAAAYAVGSSLSDIMRLVRAREARK